jgi:hypothetical protein
MQSPTNPDLLSELSEREYVLAVFGTIPKKGSGAESFGWWLTVDSIAESVARGGELREITPHIEGIGAHTDGYLLIYISKANRDFVTIEDLESMKRIVDIRAEKQNVKDMPLVFKVSGPIQVLYLPPDPPVNQPLMETLLFNIETQFILLSYFADSIIKSVKGVFS